MRNWLLGKTEKRFLLRPVRRHVTVAAGYHCDDGVVLCADTQETIPGYTKTDANKLIAFPSDSLNLVFAGAGNNAVQIDETTYEIAAQIQEKCPAGGADLKVVLRECLHSLFPLPHYP